MFKKSFIIIIISFLISPQVLALSEKCEYKKEYETCVNENRNPSGSPLAIEDFLCIQSKDNEQILYQIILDLKFKEIDKTAKSYLKNLEQNKSLYFGHNSSKHLINALDDIEKNLGFNGIFAKKYKKLCNEDILKTTLSCLEEGTISINAGDFLENYQSGGACNTITDFKLSSYKTVAYNILKLNKLQIRKDNKKLLMQSQRKKYEYLVDIISVNLSYLGRILAKWPSVTKNVY